MDEFVWDYLRTTVGAAAVIAPGGRPAITAEEDIDRMKALCVQIYKNRGIFIFNFIKILSPIDFIVKSIIIKLMGFFI